MPLDVALGLIVWGVVRRRRAPLWIGVIVLLASSSPIVARYLVRAAEGWAEAKLAPASRPADAIVVLSAGLVRAPGGSGRIEWIDANRFFGGIELFQAGKAPLLVFTGGWLPWDARAPLEGELLAQKARELGVPAARIVVTGRVSSTDEEAVAVAGLLRERRGPGASVLLVTSAYHMPRAQQLFAHRGLVVMPFPVDFAISSGGRLPIADILPSAAALASTQLALREFYGRAFYRLRDLF